MIDILQTAKQLLEFCDQRDWRSCIIGGIAVQRWGEPRVTRYLDIRDAEGVAIRNREQLDWGYVEEQLRPLAEVKGEPEILRALARLQQV